MDSKGLIETLYKPLRDSAWRLLQLAQSAHLDVRIPQTGALRTVRDQELIYGKERWTLHYLGLALDVEPVIHEADREQWRKKYNAWPWWDLLQTELAVAAGFDEPQRWQRERDRPHCQCLFGVSEEMLKQLWYASKGDIEECWKYVDVHGGGKR